MPGAPVALQLKVKLPWWWRPYAYARAGWIVLRTGEQPSQAQMDRITSRVVRRALVAHKVGASKPSWPGRLLGLHANWRRRAAIRGDIRALNQAIRDVDVTDAPGIEAILLGEVARLEAELDGVRLL